MQVTRSITIETPAVMVTVSMDENHCTTVADMLELFKDAMSGLGYYIKGDLVVDDDWQSGLGEK